MSTDDNVTVPRIWVQVYKEKQNNQNGVEELSLLFVETPLNAATLKEAVHRKKSRTLKYCEEDELKVYPPGTDIPNGLVDENALKPRDLLVDVIENARKKGMKEDDITFIVVAPTVQSQGQQQLVQQQELMLLQQESTRLSSINENRTLEAKVMEKLKLMDDVHKFLVKRDRATPQKTPASHGKDEHARLEREGKVKKFEGIPGKPSILAANDMARLAELENEHELVAFITPHIEKIFSEEVHSTTVVVNSEEYKWLKASEDSNYNLKPDLFVCHKAVYCTRKPFRCQERVAHMRRESNIFGVLSDWKLRRFLYLVCEAKTSINNQGLGEVINYASHISFDEDGPVTVRLVLFDKTSFWLIECVKGHASSIEKCRWSQAGSVSHFKKFALRDPLMEVLDEACEKYGVTVESECFLGQGGFGVVFRVRRGDGKWLAVKIVRDEKSNVMHLKKQIEATNQAKGKCPDFVVGIEENSFMYFEGRAAVVLQSEVGDHYSTLSGRKIMDALAALHSENILHGDCRVENIVNVDGQARWIDFCHAYHFWSTNISEEKEKEVKELRQSISRAFGE